MEGREMSIEVLPGCEIVVYDHISGQHRKATVVSRYGKKTSIGRYPDLIDVKFTDGKISKAHFTEFAFFPQEYSSQLSGANNGLG